MALDVRALPDRPLQVVMMGTSLTALYDWPEAVRAGLEACLDHPVDLTVVARPGAQSPWGVAQLPQVVQVRPDMVVIEMAVNDADARGGVWLRDSRAAHEEMIEVILAADPAPQLAVMTMNSAHGLRGLLRWRLGAYYGMVVDLAQDRDVGVMDLYARWLSRPVRARGLEADGLHPDADVARALIREALVPYLAAGRGGVCAPGD